MEATALLTADHNRVRGLFTQFRAAHEAENTARMGESASAILEELEVHTSIEEDIFYPAVREASHELDELVSEGIEEHHVVDVLAAEIKALPPGNEEWVAKMKVLIENVEHHAEEEEQELFPGVRGALAKEILEALGEQLESQKAELGAGTIADKEHLSVEELRQLAQAQEIPGRSEMNREELLATVAPPR